LSVISGYLSLKIHPAIDHFSQSTDKLSANLRIKIIGVLLGKLELL
jgi:hypothetical protein